MSAYYNENDPKAAAWLRALIQDGLIASGDVDERSISEVRASDVAGYSQCHFFAGIGGWSYALRLAGWEDNRHVWTGSCPCQPFSDAGKGLAEKDARHLWPVFRELIREGQPSVCFGEQVASNKGREWLAGVFADLEAMDYRRAGADLCAAGVTAPHRRQRLYWVGYADQRRREQFDGPCRNGFQVFGVRGSTDNDGAQSVADAEHDGGRTDQPGRETEERIIDGRFSPLGNANGSGCREQYGAVAIPEEQLPAECRGDVGAVDDATSARRYRKIANAESETRDETRLRVSGVGRSDSGGNGGHVDRPDWSRFDVIQCRDDKARRVEAGTFPLDHGLPGRVGLLRGYGNAIVPQVAAEFIQACEEAIAV